jgi:hypothetical protein
MKSAGRQGAENANYMEKGYLLYSFHFLNYGSWYIKFIVK